MNPLPRVRADDHRSSARKAAVIEKLLFLVGGHPTQHFVAMREAAEASHDVGMAFRKFRILRFTDGPEQVDASFLIDKFFRMHERHKEELSQRRVNALVGASAIAWLATSHASTSVA